MPNKLTDAEVKKALECIVQCKECCETEECQYYMDNGNICDNISLAKDALDLINRQEEEKQSLKAEVERLKKETKKCKEHYKMACSERNEFLKQLETAKAEAYKEAFEKAKLIISDIVDLIFDDNISKCQLSNCHKPSNIPCENEICIQENKEYWHSKLDNLLNKLVGDGNDHE